VTTVFLTVSFLTFLSLIGQLQPIQILKQAEAQTGDYDIMIMGNTKQPLVYSRRNFYVDDLEFFNSELQPKVEHAKQSVDF
jgi:hypothetical protein